MQITKQLQYSSLRRACHASASGFRQLTAFHQTNAVLEGLNTAIQPAVFVTSQLNRAPDAACVPRRDVANLEMHHMDSARTRHYVYSCRDEPEDSPD